MLDAITIVAFIVFLREGIEAILITAIIYAFIVKLKVDKGKKYVALGVSGALFLSLGLAGLIFTLAFAFEGLTEKLFEGFISITAAVILTYMILWMVKMQRTLKQT